MSERCEATGLCDAGNLGDSSPWDVHFPSPKPSSSPDSKVVQILPLSPGVLHQNNGIGQDADFQGMAKAGSNSMEFQQSLPTAASPGGPALPPSAHGQNREEFPCGSQGAAESWPVSLKVQNNLRGISQVPSDDEDA